MFCARKEVKPGDFTEFFESFTRRECSDLFSMINVAAMPHSEADGGALKKLYRSRWLLRELVLRDLRLRYRGSVLGFFWTLLNPMLFMGVYILVFGTFLHLGFHNYAAYVLSGNLAFLWFSAGLSQGTAAVVNGRMYVGKTVFPSEVLVLVPVLSGAINFLLSTPLLLVVDLILGQHLGWSLAYLPVVVFAQIMICAGIAFFLAAINVFYRDLSQLVGYLVLILFYFTPVFYQVEIVPRPYRDIILASPLTTMIMTYHDILFYGRAPNVLSIVYLLLVGSMLIVAGYSFFSRYSELFGEYL